MDPSPLVTTVYEANFKEAYTKLVDEQSVSCTLSGTVYPAISSPRAALLDVR